MKPTGCLGLLAFVLVACSAEKPASPPASTPVGSSASSAAPGAAIASRSRPPERQPEDKAEAPLCNAVREGDAARTKELLDGGADPLTPCTDLVSTSVSSGVISGFETMPALLVAARHETPALIDLLLAAQAPVDARNDDGQTALMVAARGARARVVKTLLSAGANVNERDHQGRTALMLVDDEPSLSETLLSAVAREEAQEAARKRMASGIETVEALLAAGADVNAVDRNRKTALVLARVGGRTHIVNALLQAGTAATGAPSSDSARRLAFIAGYLDLFGNALAQRGGKDVGDKYVIRAGLMRDVARRNISSQVEFLRNVDDGIRRGMNDFNSVDSRLLSVTVIEHEQEGLSLMLSLVEAHSASADSSSNAILDRWEAFVQQLPQDSTAAAAAINETYATSGIPFSYFVVRGLEPSALAGLAVRPHPCGNVAVVQSPTIAPSDVRIDSEKVFEVDRKGRAIRSWPVPVDQTPGGVVDNELLLPSHAGGRKDLWIAVKPDGRYRVVPARGDWAAPANVTCPPHKLFERSAYVQCMLVRADDSKGTERYLVYEAACS